MWSTVERLVGRGRRACDGVSADDLCTFFAEQVDRIRTTTSGSSPATFRPASTGATFTEFAPLTPADVAAGIARLSDKSSAADPLPVSTL